MKTLAVACCVLLFAVGATGDVLYPAALTFEPGYASGPPAGFPVHDVAPHYGDPLTIVGRVAEVKQPFDDLLPADTYELTFVFEGTTCTQWGMWDDIPCAGGIFGTFQGGTVAIYLDASPDADFANPQTFHDGDLVLLGSLSIVSVLDSDPYIACPPRSDEPDVGAFFTFIGGTWFSRVSNDGVGFDAISEGELDDNVSAELRALGYTFRVDGTVDIYGPVATEPVTWGRVKALYR